MYVERNTWKTIYTSKIYQTSCSSSLRRKSTFFINQKIKDGYLIIMLLGTNKFVRSVCVKIIVLKVQSAFCLLSIFRILLSSFISRFIVFISVNVFHIKRIAKSQEHMWCSTTSSKCEIYVSGSGRWIKIELH